VSYLADVNGEPTTATPGAHGTCRQCEAPMLAKCGRIVPWHWAHVARVAHCDPWQQPDTRWTLAIKQRLADDGAEIETIVEHDGERHIVDALFDGLAILLVSGRYPTPEQIEERERFFGAHTVWIYDADPFIHRVETYRKGGDLRFRFKQPVKSLTLIRAPVLWHWEPQARSIDSEVEPESMPRRDVFARVKWIKRYPHEDAYGDTVHRCFGGLQMVGETPDLMRWLQGRALLATPFGQHLDRLVNPREGRSP
jgi:hypothetical protein